MKCIYTIIFLLLILVTNGQNKRLSIIGSSTSACTGPSSFATCYVGRLDAYYDGIGQPIDIFQLAVGGYTVYKGMPTSYIGPSPNLQPDPNNNITRALSFNPDVVLVNYPSNGYDTLRIDSVMRCFRTIRDSANAQGKTCYITTTQPRHAFPFNTMAARQKLKELRDSIMTQFGYFAIDFWNDLADPATYAILPAYDSGDGIHLNDAGHNILFQRVRDKNIFAVQLPVKLKSFAARPQQEQVNISWSVLDELSGTRYEVQRSADGIAFEAIHTTISGSASATRTYQAADNTATAGVYYYRLKVTENAKTFFSQVVKLFTGKNKVSLKSFSVDPASKKLVLKVQAAESMRMQFNVVNSAGVIVHKTTQVLQPGENRLTFNLNHLAVGAYWTECIADDQPVFTTGFRLF